MIYGWKKLPTFTPGNSSLTTQFSILIPYRNEAENLPGFLESIECLKYPKDNFEILLVNDESDDNSEAICKAFAQTRHELQISLLSNTRQSNSPKKDAITTAVKKSKI